MPAPITAIGTLDFTQPIRWGCPRLDEPEDGWDTMTEMLLLPDPGFLAKGTQRPTPAGLTGKFWVQNVRIAEWHVGRPLAEVTSHGLANGKPAKWTGQAAVNEAPYVVTNFVVAYKWTTPRVVKRWISETPVLITDFVSIPLVPDETFGLPRTPYSLSQLGQEWTAFGWFGEDRRIEPLVGTDACLVTDIYAYDIGYDRTDITDPFFN